MCTRDPILKLGTNVVQEEDDTETCILLGRTPGTNVEYFGKNIGYFEVRYTDTGADNSEQTFWGPVPKSGYGSLENVRMVYADFS